MGRTETEYWTFDSFELQITILLTELENLVNAEINESFIYILFKFYLQVESRCIIQQCGPASFCWFVIWNDHVSWFALGKLIN